MKLKTKVGRLAFALILSVCMAFTMVPSIAWAAGEADASNDSAAEQNAGHSADVVQDSDDANGAQDGQEVQSEQESNEQTVAGDEPQDIQENNAESADSNVMKALGEGRSGIPDDAEFQIYIQDGEDDFSPIEDYSIFTEDVIGITLVWINDEDVQRVDEDLYDFKWDVGGNIRTETGNFTTVGGDEFTEDEDTLNVRVYFKPIAEEEFPSEPAAEIEFTLEADYDLYPNDLEYGKSLITGQTFTIPEVIDGTLDLAEKQDISVDIRVDEIEVSDEEVIKAEKITDDPESEENYWQITALDKNGRATATLSCSTEYEGTSYCTYPEIEIEVLDEYYEIDVNEYQPEFTVGKEDEGSINYIQANKKYAFDPVVVHYSTDNVDGETIESGISFEYDCSNETLKFNEQDNTIRLAEGGHGTIKVTVIDDSNDTVLCDRDYVFYEPDVRFVLESAQYDSDGNECFFSDTPTPIPAEAYLCEYGFIYRTDGTIADSEEFSASVNVAVGDNVLPFEREDYYYTVSIDDISGCEALLFSYSIEMNDEVIGSGEYEVRVVDPYYAFSSFSGNLLTGESVLIFNHENIEYHSGSSDYSFLYPEITNIEYDGDVVSIVDDRDETGYWRIEALKLGTAEITIHALNEGTNESFSFTQTITVSNERYYFEIDSEPVYNQYNVSILKGEEKEFQMNVMRQTAGEEAAENVTDEFALSLENPFDQYETNIDESGKLTVNVPKEIYDSYFFFSIEAISETLNKELTCNINVDARDYIIELSNNEKNNVPLGDEGYVIEPVIERVTLDEDGQRISEEISLDNELLVFNINEDTIDNCSASVQSDGIKIVPGSEERGSWFNCDVMYGGEFVGWIIYGFIPDDGTTAIITTVPEPIEGLEYTGDAQTLIKAGEAVHGTMKYAVKEENVYPDSNEWSESIPTETEIGTYYVWYKAFGDDGFNDSYDSYVTVTISAPKVIITERPQAIEGLEYTGEPQALITDGKAVNGTMVYAISDDEPGANSDAWSEELPTRTNIGEYKVWYKAVGMYGADDTDPEYVDAAISKAKAKVTEEPDPLQDLVYTGAPMTLIAEGAASGGDVVYAISEAKPEADSDAWSADLPEETNAGTYKVWYKAVGDENHDDSEVAGPVEATIAKADTSVVTAPSSNNATYDGTDKVLLQPGEAEGGAFQYALADTDSWSADIPTAVNAGTYNVLYKVVGDANHNDSEVAGPIEATISKADASVVTAPTANPSTYDGSDKALIQPGEAKGGSFQYALQSTESWSADIPTATNAGTYNVLYKVVGDANHNDSEVGGPVEVTIEKADATVSTPPTANTGLEETGEPLTLITEGTPSDGELHMFYAISDDEPAADSDAWSEELPKGTDAGTYKVWYKVVGNENYNDSEVGGPVEVSIAEQGTAEMEQAKIDATTAISNAGNLNEADWTADSYQAVTDAAAALQELLDDPSSTAEQIKQATSDLNTAISNLVTSAIKVKTIALSGISHNIAAGKRIQLSAAVGPANATNKAVTWTSSNTGVATVSASGLVTVKAKTGGKSVTITARAKDGSGVYAAYSIKSMKGVVKKITIKGKKKVKAGKSVKLKAKVKASKGANKAVIWSSSNTAYAKVSTKGNVTTYAAGKGKTVKITAVATDGSNKKKTVKIKIK